MGKFVLLSRQISATLILHSVYYIVISLERITFSNRYLSF